MSQMPQQHDVHEYDRVFRSLVIGQKVNDDEAGIFHIAAIIAGLIQMIHTFSY